MLDREKIIEKLEKDGLEEVKRKLTAGTYAPKRKVEVVEEWVHDKEGESQKAQDAPTYMYHPTKAPEGQIFKASEVQELEKNSWCDSPSKFPEKNSILVFIKAFWLKHWKFIISSIIAIMAIYFGYIK